MSVKAVKQYYKEISEQYKEMLENIQDLEQEAAQGMVEPERIERLKDQIAPIKQNYERWSYMIYLLNQPQRKEKQPRYKERNKRLLASLSKQNSLDAVRAENAEALKHIGE